MTNLSTLIHLRNEHVENLASAFDFDAIQLNCGLVLHGYVKTSKIHKKTKRNNLAKASGRLMNFGDSIVKKSPSRTKPLCANNETFFKLWELTVGH